MRAGGRSGGSLQALVISAAMGALALTLPVAFHAAGLGSKFLPMLLPLLLNGFLVPVRWAVLTALVIPILSALLTGMPPVYPPMVLVVAGEGIVMGGLAAALYRQGGGRLWPALITAVIAGRVFGFAFMWMLAKWFGLPAGVAAVAAIVQGAPGVALQVAVVPIVMRQIRKRPGILFHGYEG